MGNLKHVQKTPRTSACNRSKKQSASKSAESEDGPSKDQDERGESSDGSVFSDGDSIFRTSFVTISQYR